MRGSVEFGCAPQARKGGEAACRWSASRPMQASEGGWQLDRQDGSAGRPQSIGGSANPAGCGRVGWRGMAPPNKRVQRTRSSASPPCSRRMRRPFGGRSGAIAVVTSALLVFACHKAKPAHVIVRNPDYLVVRPIKREADAEHTAPVELPYSGAGFGFASASVLLDLNSIDLGAVTFAGGRTSIAGEATIWLPLTPEASQRLEAWSAQHAGDYLGVFLRGKLVAAPQIKSGIGGGIPLRVSSKSEGDLVLRELRSGGVAQ